MSPLGSYTTRPYQVLLQDEVALEVRQDPQFAVVTAENKEKLRRPVDPPPIVQLRVSPHRDPTREFLVNPFLFMTAALVEAEPQEHGGYNAVPGVQIIGQNVSSLHRLKDINNDDGGFFVFGDISCRNQGKYRLQFNLFDFDKSENQVAFVASIVSKPFVVVSHKEFKGLSESTHLSRTFSDQGVRLRLRKEPRTISGTKRSYDTSSQNIAPTMHPGSYGGPVLDRTYGYETPMQKRARSSGSDHTNYGSASSQYSGAGVAQYNLPNTAPAWSPHHPTAFQSDQSAYGLASHLQPQMGPHPSYQRHIQQDPYPAEAVSSNESMYYNNTRPHLSMSRYPPFSGYSQQPSQSYESRTSRDAYQALPAVQAIAPMPESALVQNHHQDFQASTPHTSVHPPSTSAGMLTNQQLQQEQGMQRTVGQYGLQHLPIHSSHPAYPPMDAHRTVYGQNTQQDMRYGQNSYHCAHNVYSADPPTGALSTSTLPLDSGVLTRSFAPGQASLEQPVYDNTNGQGIDGFKQELPPYPTSNQTSPTG